MTTKKKRREGSDFMLYRSETDRVLGGVCGGIAEALKMDAVLVRLVFLITFLFGGAGVLFYIILWIVIPSKSRLSHTSNEVIAENLEEVKTRAQEFRAQIANNDHTANNRLFIGLFIVGLGFIFLMNNFGFGSYFVNLHKFWPLILVVIGAVILLRRND